MTFCAEPGRQASYSPVNAFQTRTYPLPPILERNGLGNFIEVFINAGTLVYLRKSK